MRKVENIKIIPERKEITTTYYGNCPSCGHEQSSSNHTLVDRECASCEKKRKKKERQDFLDNYIGATILKIEEDNRIIIQIKDGRVYELYNLADEYEGHCEGCTRMYEINEIHEGDASWFQ